MRYLKTKRLQAGQAFIGKLIRQNEASKVIYLPSIGESPTKVSTEQEVPPNVKAKAESRGLKQGDVALDHVIDKLALEVPWSYNTKLHGSANAS